MKHTNVEIKAKCFHPEKVEAFLFAHNANFKGIDLQRDTYFNVPNGRLKLREGNIENDLIFYKRENKKEPKQSEFHLVPVNDMPGIKDLLTEALVIKIVVGKTRKIFFLDNIKIHLDNVPGLGNFIEIEAGNISNPQLTVEQLHEQCTQLMKDLNVRKEDLIHESYSDMLLAGREV